MALWLPSDIKGRVDCDRELYDFLKLFPVEIITQILKLTRGYSKRGDVALLPWRLGAICSEIRAVALHTQRLWSDIRINSVDDVPVITLSRLRMIRTETLLILVPLILPSLEQLVVDHLDMWSIQELRDFLLHSPLTVLKNIAINDEGRVVATLLALSPFTTHLTLPIHDVYYDMLELLQGGMGDVIVGPQVTDLTLLIHEQLMGASFSMSVFNTLLLMLHSRRNGWHGCQKLRSLTITSHQLSAGQIAGLRRGSGKNAAA
ncbi:hypothetical protein C8R44DRAFT_891424 [Mycena epipterygia]|nr:hypothetical protein C8R44DRAFT_891424 [Mycena epipterygia]